jgi:hypothetical protein
MAEYTYVLYLTIDHTPFDDEIIFLGSSAEHDLYYKAVSIQYEVKPEDVSIVSENMKIIAVWKELVKAELSAFEAAAVIDTAFMKGENYSYTLKHMTLHLEKVQSFDSYY